MFYDDSSPRPNLPRRSLEPCATDEFRAWVATELTQVDPSLWEIESFLRLGDADLDLPRRLVPSLTPQAIEPF